MVQALATTLLVSACANSGPAVEPPNPPPSLAAPKASSENSKFSEACAQWDPSLLEWRKLLDASSKTVSDSVGVEAVLSRSSLPSSEANRYNTGVEICPGFLWIVTHAGESRFISLTDQTWSEGPKLETSGSTENIGAPGVESGGAVWGFRGSVASGEWLYLSDAVVDTEALCARVDVHRVAISGLLASDNSTQSPSSFTSLALTKNREFILYLEIPVPPLGADVVRLDSWMRIFSPTVTPPRDAISICNLSVVQTT